MNFIDFQSAQQHQKKGKTNKQKTGKFRHDSTWIRTHSHEILHNVLQN